MALTKLPKSTRFFAPGVTEVYYLPAVANPESVTRAEIGAGKSLRDEIADVSGWTPQSNLIDTPDWGSTFTSKIAGRDSIDSSTITFYADKTGDDVRAILPRGTEGYIVFADGGDVAGNPCDVFEVFVASVGKVRSGDNANTIVLTFAITDQPAEDVELPATV